jgi:hypothetical protein
MMFIAVAKRLGRYTAHALTAVGLLLLALSFSVLDSSPLVTVPPRRQPFRPHPATRLFGNA